MLGRHPLFTGNTKEKMLEEIKAFHSNIDQWKKTAMENKDLFDDKIWQLVTQLLDVDVAKRISSKVAKEFLRQHFPNTAKHPESKTIGNCK